jgi:hypothetical protein
VGVLVGVEDAEAEAEEEAGGRRSRSRINERPAGGVLAPRG